MRNVLILLTLFAALLLVIACSDTDTVSARIEVTSSLNNWSTTRYITARSDARSISVFNCAGWVDDSVDPGVYYGIAQFSNNVNYSMEIHDSNDNDTVKWRARVEVLDNDSDDIISYARQKELIQQKMCDYLKEPDNVTNGWESLTLED